MCFPHSVAARQVAGPLIHAIYGSFVELSADSISILVHRRTRNGAIHRSSAIDEIAERRYSPHPCAALRPVSPDCGE